MSKLTPIFQEFNITPLTISVNLRGWGSKRILPRIWQGRVATLNKDNSLTFYVEAKAWDAASEYVNSYLVPNKKFITLLYKKSLKIGGKILKDSRALRQKDLSKIPAPVFLKEIENFYQLGVELCILGYIPVFSDYWTNLLSKTLNTIIAQQGKNFSGYTPAEAISLLSSPTLFYPSQRARVDLLNLIIRKKHRDKLSLQEWILKWGWIEYGHLGPWYTKERLKQELKRIGSAVRAKLQLKKLLKDKKLLKQKQEKLKGQLNLNQAERFFAAARDFTYLKGYRGEVSYLIYAELQRLAEYLSQKTGVKKELLLQCDFNELKEFFRGRLPVSKNELEARQKLSVWVMQREGEVKILSSQKAKQFIKQHCQETEGVKKSEILTGQVAYPGKVRGKVTIVNTREEMKKFSPGDILVSMQTSPELLPVMKMAKAFIGEIGGITCHTAIVSREMKKPCLVGVKGATRVLGDGDEVEVDAEKGIVRKLK